MTPSQVLTLSVHTSLGERGARAESAGHTSSRAAPGEAVRERPARCEPLGVTGGGGAGRRREWGTRTGGGGGGAGSEGTGQAQARAGPSDVVRMGS